MEMMMHDLRTVIRLEFLLLRRGRGLPIAAALVALAGVWEASGIREQPWAVWSTLTLVRGRTWRSLALPQRV